MFCEPPRGRGQPTACAVKPSTIAKDAVSGSSNASVECAASPANKPRVFSSRNTVRAKNFADQSAHTPKYPSKNGLRGKRSSGPRIIGASELQRDASGEKILDHIAPSRPKPRAVC